MPLEVTRSFIQNRDGTYEPFKCPKVEVESIPETYGRLEKQPPVLRPLELKTFLKVGMFAVGLLCSLLVSSALKRAASFSPL